MYSFFNLCTTWRWADNATPWPLYSMKTGTLHAWVVAPDVRSGWTWKICLTSLFVLVIILSGDCRQAIKYVTEQCGMFHLYCHLAYLLHSYHMGWGIWSVNILWWKSWTAFLITSHRSYSDNQSVSLLPVNEFWVCLLFCSCSSSIAALGGSGRKHCVVSDAAASTEHCDIYSIMYITDGNCEGQNEHTAQ
jgi:hypothetical protein